MVEHIPSGNLEIRRYILWGFGITPKPEMVGKRQQEELRLWHDRMSDQIPPKMGSPLVGSPPLGLHLDHDLEFVRRRIH